jgi:hypothetical protein
MKEIRETTYIKNSDGILGLGIRQRRKKMIERIF